MGKGLLLGTVELDVKAAPRRATRADGGEIQRFDRTIVVHGERAEPWFDLPMPNRVWDWVWVSAETVALAYPDHATHAVSFPSDALIIIDRSLKERRQRRTLRTIVFHELVHIGFFREGQKYTYPLGRTEKAANDREEFCCSTLSDQLANPMAAARMFRLPPISRTKC